MDLSSDLGTDFDYSTSVCFESDSSNDYSNESSLSQDQNQPQNIIDRGHHSISKENLDTSVEMKVEKDEGLCSTDRNIGDGSRNVKKSGDNRENHG